jgi:SulP family sulfate permease
MLDDSFTTPRRASRDINGDGGMGSGNDDDAIFPTSGIPLTASSSRRVAVDADGGEAGGGAHTLLDSMASEPGEIKPKSTRENVFDASLFGVINGIVILPVMIGFAQIIFRDAFFTPYMGSLTKLVLFSSVVHQLTFSAR